MQLDPNKNIPSIIVTFFDDLKNERVPRDRFLSIYNNIYDVHLEHRYLLGKLHSEITNTIKEFIDKLINEITIRCEPLQFVDKTTRFRNFIEKLDICFICLVKT